MPLRSEEDLDPVTLHNQALLNVEANPTDCVKKLQFLLQQEPCPPEAFANLLLVLVKHEVSRSFGVSIYQCIYSIAKSSVEERKKTGAIERDIYKYRFTGTGI